MEFTGILTWTTTESYEFTGVGWRWWSDSWARAWGALPGRLGQAQAAERAR